MRSFIVICGTLLSAVFSSSVSAQSANDHLRALMTEKTTRSAAQHKMDSSLVIPLRKHRGEVGGLPALRQPYSKDSHGKILVEVQGKITPALASLVKRLDGEIVSSHPRFNTMRAKMTLAAMETLAEDAAVRFIRPAFKPMLQGTVINEGDGAHAADQARSQFSVDGSGVTVGVISDSVDALGDLQTSGELPPGVTVLPGQSGNPGSSEGTALLEIVHDIAPGADLLFATGSGGEAQFAQNILDLQAAGADIIVDDVVYFTESAFQDGIVAQAVDTVAGLGTLVFSSAGNSGNLNDGQSGVWEGEYVGAALPAPLTGAGIDAHDFGGGDTGNAITFDSPAFFTLQWSNPNAGATDDYDLYLLDAGMTTVINASTNTQSGTQDPIEGMDSGFVDDTGNVLVIVKFSGDDQFLHLNTHRGRLEHGTDGQLFGHAGAEGAIAVAASNVANASGGVFTGGPANPVEPFSSDGPRRIFFESDGTPVSGTGAQRAVEGSVFITRQKPDITAADGIQTTTPGFSPFFGTSAAAPVAAGMAALLRELASATTLDELLQMFEQIALDIEATGIDRDSGFGIPLATDMLQFFTPGISVSPTSGLSVSEDGSVTDSFSVTLDTEPTADVSVDFSTTLPEVGVNPTTLTFTPVNFDQPQSVTVSGSDDDIDNGDRDFVIVTQPATSADIAYDNLDTDDVSGEITDDDTVGMSVSPTEIITSEDGTTDTFTVTLDSEPIFDVSVDVRSQDTTEGLVSDDNVTFQESVTLTFDDANWDIAQTVTVQGQDDDLRGSLRGIIDGDVQYGITFETSSSDTLYDQLFATPTAVVTVTNIDTDDLIFSDSFGEVVR